MEATYAERNIDITKELKSEEVGFGKDFANHNIQNVLDSSDLGIWGRLNLRPIVTTYQDKHAEILEKIAQAKIDNDPQQIQLLLMEDKQNARHAYDYIRTHYPADEYPDIAKKLESFDEFHKSLRNLDITDANTNYERGASFDIEQSNEWQNVQNLANSEEQQNLSRYQELEQQFNNPQLMRAISPETADLIEKIKADKNIPDDKKLDAYCSAIDTQQVKLGRLDVAQAKYFNQDLDVPAYFSGQKPFNLERSPVAKAYQEKIEQEGISQKVTPYAQLNLNMMVESMKNGDLQSMLKQLTNPTLSLEKHAQLNQKLGVNNNNELENDLNRSNNMQMKPKI